MVQPVDWAVARLPRERREMPRLNRSFATSTNADSIQESMQTSSKRLFESSDPF
jgi:hypothetical protein